MNISATINVFRLLVSPQLCLPHLTVSSFDRIPVPLPQPKIKAIVLDKDNCFAKAHDDKVWPEYKQQWERLRAAYPDTQLLIVSNSAGTNDDPNHSQAQILEERTGVTVLRHSTKKPGCHGEIMEYFLGKGVVKGPEEVAVIGDRLFTDVLMANMMGSYGIWVRDGVVRSESLICRIERAVYDKLISSKWVPPFPGN
jgi:phosphatidylglycerophosphatase GEP4